MSNKDLRSNQNTLWEEAGSEFYQENYNKAANRGVSSTTTMTRISLPSHTARRNSGWKTTTHTHRHSTICGTEYIVDGIPDLADESLPNEKSTTDQLLSFKGMPITMGEKRGLKAQLITNPILKLTGWRSFKWKMGNFFKSVYEIRKHFKYTLFKSTLKSIENRFGFVFTTYFEDIKTLLCLNLLSIFLFSIYYLCQHGIGELKFNYEDYLPLAIMNNSLSTSTPKFGWNLLSTDNFTDFLSNPQSCIYYGHYDIRAGGLILLLLVIYLGLTVIYYFAQIWECLKATIENKHVKHVFSDLIFCSMDHFTKCKSGAEFKRGAIQKEIRTHVQNDVANESNRLGLIGIRTCVNLITVGLISICVAFISHLQEFSHNFNFADSKYDPIEIIIHFLPQIFACISWTILSFFMERMGKWEKFDYETRIFTLVLRCWIIRMVLLGGFFLKFYNMIYFEQQTGNSLIETTCWESALAQEIYKFLIVDMALKILVTFMLEPIRALLRRILPIGAVHFHLIRNYLDILNIQLLSWFGIYFTPVLPLAISIYSILLFFVKTFSLLANCSGTPDIFRPIKTLMTKIKLVTFLIAIAMLTFILGWMKPSTECGPFREYSSTGEYIKKTIKDNITDYFLTHLKCPQWSLPLFVICLCLCIYYKCVISNGEKMIQTLRHLLVLEGHDKQFLFRAMQGRVDGGMQGTT